MSLFPPPVGARRLSLATRLAVLRPLIVPGALLFLFYLLHFFLTRYLCGDYPSHHLSATMYQKMTDVYDLIRGGLWSRASFQMSVDAYPPLFTLFGCAFTGIFGKSWAFLTLGNNGFYLVLLILSLYLLGRELFDEKAGVAAVILACLYPGTYWTFVMGYPTDFALSGLVTLSFYVLYRSGSFRNTPWSLAFGVCCGWGMMNKDPFGAFLLGPALFGFAGVVRDASRKEYRPLLNFALFCAVAAVIMFPYYSTNWQYVIKRLYWESTPEPWYHFNNLKIFLVDIWQNQLSFAFSALFLAGAYVFFRRMKRNVTVPVFLWLLFPVLILLFMPHWRSGRYVEPLLPAIALITAGGLRRVVPSGRAMRWSLAVVAIFGVWQCADLFYINGPLYRFSSGPLRYFGPTEHLVPLRDMQGNGRKMELLCRTLEHEFGTTPRQGQAPPEAVVLSDSPDLRGKWPDPDILLWFRNVNVRLSGIQTDITADQVLSPAVRCAVVFSHDERLSRLDVRDFANVVLPDDRDAAGEARRRIGDRFVRARSYLLDRDEGLWMHLFSAGAPLPLPASR